MSVEAACAAQVDARALRLAVLDELRRIVPFDAFAWLLTDPNSEVGTAPIADVPCLPDLPRLIRLKYATTVNRWTSQAQPVATLHLATSGRLEASLMWRELLRDHGVTDIASMVFRDRFGCWAFLDLWRIGGGFTAAEIRSLEKTIDVVTVALRQCTLRTFDPPPVQPSTELRGAASYSSAVILRSVPRRRRPSSI